MVVANVEAQIAAVRAAYPEFEGKSVIVAEYLEPGSYYIFDPENIRYRLQSRWASSRPRPCWPFIRMASSMGRSAVSGWICSKPIC